MAKHKNYEILNLIGYALAKFDNDFIKEFGFSTKNAFFEYCVQIGLADTTGVIKNRMDLFDYFFPNKRIYLIIFFLTNAKVGGKKAMPISIENYGLIVCLKMKALRVLAIL
ncbi:hypothetical protein VN0274_02310 [Helicobacter pylori]|nr:hypothetical protein VN0274_02310 [Helicobacter pylori]